MFSNPCTGVCHPAENMNLYMCSRRAHMCVYTSRGMSEHGGRAWGFAWTMLESSSNHVYGRCWHAERSRVPMQLSWPTRHHVLFTDLSVERRMGKRWVERGKRKAEGERRKRKDKPNVHGRARRRGWWQEDKLWRMGGICAECPDGWDGRGLHVGIIGSLYTRS